MCCVGYESETENVSCGKSMCAPEDMSIDGCVRLTHTLFANTCVQLSASSDATKHRQRDS